MCLSNYIYIVSNRVDYDLLFRVHTLFFKYNPAKTKQDKTDWWQSKNGTFAEDFWKSAIKQIKTLEYMYAWDVSEHGYIIKVIDYI